MPDVPLLLGGAAGALGALALREAFRAVPGAAIWLAESVEPLRRAEREGYAPSESERRRLAWIVAGTLVAAGGLIFGPGPAPLLALAGPAAATFALARRRARYRRTVERALPEVATAVADALSGGRSVRAALGSAAASLEGAPAVEMARVRADLDLGASTAQALAALERRVGSERVGALVAAVLSQQLGGGDLAGLLRRFAAASAERDRVAADARSATAQARFTGMLVVAMPVGAALFAELVDPGFVSGLVADGPARIALLLAAILQAAGFVAIGRLSRVADQ